LSEAEATCDRIAIINRGKIIENTSKRELLRKLDKETFLCDTKEVVTRVAPLENVDFALIDETRIEVTKNKSQSINCIFEHLNSQGIIVDSMRNKTNRLEELFLEMVK